MASEGAATNVDEATTANIDTATFETEGDADR
jgi:hypothetical protein